VGNAFAGLTAASLCSAGAHLSVPAYANAEPQRAVAVKDRLLLQRSPAGLGLDGREHCGMLISAGAPAPRMEGESMSNSNELFAAALGVASPWHVADLTFDAGKRLLVINIDFAKGSKFPYPGVEGLHPVHDTVLKRYRHLNFFQSRSPHAAPYCRATYVERP
jgi:hypothetical protein